MGMYGGYVGIYQDIQDICQAFSEYRYPVCAHVQTSYFVDSTIYTKLLASRAILFAHILRLCILFERTIYIYIYIYIYISLIDIPKSTPL